MPISDAFRPRLAAKLRRLYGDRAQAALRRIDEPADRYASLSEKPVSDGRFRVEPYDIAWLA